METINLNLAVILTLGSEEKTINELTISLIDNLSRILKYFLQQIKKHQMKH